MIRNRWSSVLALVALAMTVPVSACSSSTTTAAAAPKASASQQVCEQVTAVLSDGPDPDADPVGHAEAQVLPLQQIHTSVQSLGTAITSLDEEYQSYVQANGKSKSVTSALTNAMNTINKLCPGAGAEA